MLDLQGLVKTFHPGTENEVRALQRVDLRVEEGSFVVVIGTNGSGKSTLQNAVSGSLPGGPGAHRPGYLFLLFFQSFVSDESDNQYDNSYNDITDFVTIFGCHYKRHWLF